MKRACGWKNKSGTDKIDVIDAIDDIKRYKAKIFYSINSGERIEVTFSHIILNGVTNIQFFVEGEGGPHGHPYAEYVVITFEPAIYQETQYEFESSGGGITEDGGILPHTLSMTSSVYNIDSDVAISIDIIYNENGAGGNTGGGIDE